MDIKTSKRLIYPDIAKGIGIILVVLGHIEYIPLFLRNFIVSFHMPLFFVISGILLNVNYGNYRNLKETSAIKAKKMLLPYLYFSLLYTVIYILYYMATGRDGGLQTVISYLVNTVTLYGISVLWFIPALYWSEVVFLHLRRKYSAPGAAIISVICAAASIILNNYLALANMLYGNQLIFAVVHLILFTLLRIMFCMLFITIGYFLSPLISRFLAGHKIRNILISVVLFALCFFVSQMNGVTDLHYLVFNSLPLYLVSSLSGVVALIALSLILEAFPKKAVQPFIFYGKNSLTVMLTHLDFYILYLAEIGGLHFTKSLIGTDMHDPVLSALSLIFVLAAEAFIIVFVNRFCPWIIGKGGTK